MKKIAVRFGEVSRQYNIEVGFDVLENSGDWGRSCLTRKAKRVAIVSNRKVFGLYGEAVKASFENSGFEVFVFLMNDGERHKNFRTLKNSLQFFSEKKLSRTDAIVALGGGVVGDLAGFAAAIYLRGIAFLQIPTTLLAMIDASVGGKTAVNTDYGKNLIGAFHQPAGVLIDTRTLQTLPCRELTAGFCEAIKHGVVSGKKLFNRTDGFLQNYPPNNFKKYFADEKFCGELENVVAEQVAFKAQIVAQDETESTERTDAKSRKILNFGHTFAHALEKVTSYKRFRHGEAVGYGILFAATLSKKLDFFGEKELKLLNDVVHRTGNLPVLRGVSPKDIFDALVFDKKFVDGSLQWILLKNIGEPFICKNTDISQAILKKTLEEFINE